MPNKKELTNFLKEVTEWKWDQFVIAELDHTYTTTQSVVFALIRGCAMESLSAIKSSFNRMDGKVETQVEVKMPSVFYLFPGAEESPEPLGIGAKNGDIIPIDSVRDIDAPTKGFRETMEMMMAEPRTTPLKIIAAQDQVEKYVRKEGSCPPNIPYVKSVVVAHLLKMSYERDFAAIDEVFEQLDGKLIEKIKVIGEDMYITQYVKVAPPGAIRNDDGILQMEATQTQNLWRQRLQGETMKATILNGEEN